jgi:hypothetical protein
MIPGQNGNHGSWVKCATSAEGNETDISAVLTVKSSLGILLIRDTPDTPQMMTLMMMVNDGDFNYEF